MATNGDTDRLLHRVHRDLEAPISLLVAVCPRRVAVAHRGFDASTEIDELLAADDGSNRTSDAGSNRTVRSWAVVAVQHDGVEVGRLFVADRRRRWFDDEEVRHLGLLSASAGPIVAGLVHQQLVVDVREAARVASLASSG